MTTSNPELPNPIVKVVEANQAAEDALNKTPQPDIELAQAWAAVAANWASIVDPRSLQLRRMSDLRGKV